ncbi:hypothetical protein DsansV1_C06g0064711 [Dioscorea sansibarensis]
MASSLTAILCESLSWLLIYRTPTYNTLRSSIDRASTKLESMKSMDLLLFLIFQETIVQI